MKHLRPHHLPPLESDTMPGPRRTRVKKQFGVRTTSNWIWGGRTIKWDRWYKTKSAQDNAFQAALKDKYVRNVEKIER